MNWLRDLPKKPRTTRFLMYVVAVFALFLISALLLIFAPRSYDVVLKGVLLVGCFLSGVFFVHLGFAWILSWVVPTAFFVALAFLRLDGASALTLLIGYIPLALGGALLMLMIKQQQRSKRR